MKNGFILTSHKTKKGSDRSANSAQRYGSLYLPNLAMFRVRLTAWYANCIDRKKFQVSFCVDFAVFARLSPYNVSRVEFQETSKRYVYNCSF